jgi:hypothetical protein
MATELNKVEIGKAVVGIIVSAGVTQVVSGVIATNVPTRNIFHKSVVWIGKTVISSMITEAATKHVDQKIDDTIEWWEENVSATLKIEG